MRGNRYGRMDRYMEGGFRHRYDGQPVVNMANRMNRSQFLRTAGLGAAGLSAAAYGMSGAARAIGGDEPWENPAIPWYIGKNIDSMPVLGNWYDQVPGDIVGSCGWILAAMCAEPGTEWEVPHEGDYWYYDLYGGDLFHCGEAFDYRVYTCTAPSGPLCQDLRFLENYEETQRRATCWFFNDLDSSRILNLNIPEGGPFQLAIYVMDYEGTSGREEDITVNGVGPETVSGFYGGKYIQFAVNSGPANIEIMHTGGANAVISGLFLDPLQPKAYPYTDEDTKGDWKGAYGSIWYYLCSWNYPDNVTNDPSILDGGPEAFGMTGWRWTNPCNQLIPCNPLEPLKEENTSRAWSWSSPYYVPGEPPIPTGLIVPHDYIPPQDPQDPYYRPCPNYENLSVATWASCYDDHGEVWPANQKEPDMYVYLKLPNPEECGYGSWCYRVSFYATDQEFCRYYGGHPPMEPQYPQEPNEEDKWDYQPRKQILWVYDKDWNLVADSRDPDNVTNENWDIVGCGTYHTFFLPAGTYTVKVDYYGRVNAILSGVFIDCVECPPQGSGDFRTIGFWKHQFAVACGKNRGKAQLSRNTNELNEILQAYLEDIMAHSTVFPELVRCGEDPLTSAYKILWPDEPAEMCTRARQQLLALWLNYANGAVAPSDTVYDIIAMEEKPFSTVIEEVEWTILNDPDNCETAKTIADYINNSAEND